MVHGPMMMSRSAGIPQKYLLQSVRGTPFSSAPDIIMKQLYAQNHVRALRKLKIMKRTHPQTILGSPCKYLCIYCSLVVSLIEPC